MFPLVHALPNSPYSLQSLRLSAAPHNTPPEIGQHSPSRSVQDSRLRRNRADWHDIDSSIRQNAGHCPLPATLPPDSTSRFPPPHVAPASRLPPEVSKQND